MKIVLYRVDMRDHIIFNIVNSYTSPVRQHIYIEVAPWNSLLDPLIIKSCQIWYEMFQDLHLLCNILDRQGYNPCHIKIYLKSSVAQETVKK